MVGAAAGSAAGLPSRRFHRGTPAGARRAADPECFGDRSSIRYHFLSFVSELGGFGSSDGASLAAGAINRISHPGKLYLAAGGLGGIIGDGQLPAASRWSRHTTMWPYFSFAHFTADYQLIKNPAYNRDRGPLSVSACGS